MYISNLVPPKNLVQNLLILALHFITNRNTFVVHSYKYLSGSLKNLSGNFLMSNAM